MFSGLIPGLNSVNWTDDELSGEIPASLISLLGLPKQVLSFEAHPGTIVGVFPRIQYLVFLWQQWTQFGLVIWVYGWIAIILFIWACYTSGQEGNNGGDAASAAGEPPEETAISGPMHLFRDALFNAIGGEPCQSLCEICFEERYNWKMFRSETCSHSFCCDCISRHIAAKIQDNIAVVLCPGVDCKVALDFEECRRIIAKEVAVRWDECLCMSLIPETQRVYCPFRDCSVMLVKDPGDIVEEIDCPACQRSICAQCGVPWHSEFTCEEFERLRAKRKEKEDVFVEELAKKKSWRKCPHCKMYVEKTEGCLHITCRCAHEFCYRCGANWTKKHGDNCRQVQGFEPPLPPTPPTSYDLFFPVSRQRVDHLLPRPLFPPPPSLPEFEFDYLSHLPPPPLPPQLPVSAIFPSEVDPLWYDEDVMEMSQV